MIDYIASVDPYDRCVLVQCFVGESDLILNSEPTFRDGNSPVVVHTYPGEKEEVYEPLLGYDHFTGVSLQEDPSSGYDSTVQWVQQSAKSQHKWVVAFDEQGHFSTGVVPDSEDQRRC